MYRAPSGALVFSAGTVQWTWGLDAEHDGAYAAEPADPRMQQAQVNLLADMGAQPTTLMAGLVAATQVDRHHRPDRRPSRSPAAGADQANGATVTVTGTATDTGGGGSPASRSPPTAATPGTRPPAPPRWTYTYVQHGRRARTTIQVRAIDDSANIGAAGDPRVHRDLPVQRLRRRRCRRSPAADDAAAVELGLRFTPTATASSPASASTRAPATPAPTRVAVERRRHSGWRTVTFTGETATGWQTATFASPVAVDGRARPTSSSYTAPQRPLRRAEPTPSRCGAIDAAPFTVAGGFGADAGRRLRRRRAASRPRATGNTNYFVDVAVHAPSDDSPLIATNQSAARRAPRACPRRTTVSATFSKPVARRHRRH